MATIQIVINQAGVPAGVPGVSREDIVTGIPVILTNNDNTGATRFKWEFLSVPVDANGTSSASVITGGSTSTAQFTPDVYGTYIVKLTINGRIIGTIGIGILSLKLEKRIPGIYETKEFGQNGWGLALCSMLSKIDSYNNNFVNYVASGQLDGYYPNPTVIGLTETSGPTELSFGSIPNLSFLRRSGVSIIGDTPDLQETYAQDPAILIDSTGPISVSHEPTAQREFDIANSPLRITDLGSLVGTTGVDIVGQGDTDFAKILSRCLIDTVDIPAGVAGDVAAGVLTISDPIDLTTMSSSIIKLVQLSGEIEGLFVFSRIDATSGDLYDLDSSVNADAGHVTASFYYIRFLVGADTSAFPILGPNSKNVNMLTFGGFDNNNSGIGHLHISYKNVTTNEEFTRKAIMVDGIADGSDIAYETTEGEYHSKRIIAGVTPIIYNNNIDPTIRAKNDGLGPSIQADDYVLDSEESGYIWISLNSAHEDITGTPSWEMTSESILNIGNADWQSSYLESIQVDGYHYIEVDDWPEGMKLETIEIDWLSNIPNLPMELYAVRQTWPENSGDLRVNSPLNSVYSKIVPGDHVRRFDYFDCNQNNLNWAHATDKLVLILHASPNGISEQVFGIRLSVSYRSVSKWHTNTTTNPA